MATNFELTFENLKPAFLKLYRIPWDANPSLFLQYITAAYTSDILSLMQKGFTEVMTKQERTIEILQGIGRNLAQK